MADAITIVRPQEQTKRLQVGPIECIATGCWPYVVRGEALGKETTDDGDCAVQEYIRIFRQDSIDKTIATETTTLRISLPVGKEARHAALPNQLNHIQQFEWNGSCLGLTTAGTVLVQRLLLMASRRPRTSGTLCWRHITWCTELLL